MLADPLTKPVPSLQIKYMLEKLHISRQKQVSAEIPENTALPIETHLALVNPTIDEL